MNMELLYHCCLLTDHVGKMLFKMVYEYVNAINAAAANRANCISTLFTLIMCTFLSLDKSWSVTVCP